MYKDAARILDENGIRYFVHYGTAIGALRHDGFIPWDDDIDVVIWEEDLEKVNRLMLEGLDPEKYYYHIPMSDTHPHIIGRTGNFERDLKKRKAPFIDIFVLQKYPKVGGKRHRVNTFVWWEMVWIVLLDRFLPRLVYRPLSAIPRWLERHAKKITEDDTDITTVYSTTIKSDIFPKEYFEETFRHKFEDTEVPLPVGIDAALTGIFGDYMTPPPEDKRHGANGFPCSAYKDYKLQMKNRS